VGQGGTRVRVRAQGLGNQCLRRVGDRRLWSVLGNMTHGRKMLPIQDFKIARFQDSKEEEEDAA